MGISILSWIGVNLTRCPYARATRADSSELCDRAARLGRYFVRRLLTSVPTDIITDTGDGNPYELVDES
jgi:hypothetical protein